MKKWLRFFCCSFFSHKLSKEGAKRDYANTFLGFILALMLLWVGFIASNMLPFAAHYNSSPDFKATVRTLFANTDVSKRVGFEIQDGVLKVRGQDGEYTEALLINTFNNDSDKQNYSVNDYNVIVDLRPADALAEIEAYCVSNDGYSTLITYDEYLTLSDVARLNFDFYLSYTGNELVLNDESVEGYRAYVDGLSDENKAATEKLARSLAENTITRSEYNRAIYELYFENYYPEISEYESTSKVPLLRNYYYHKYIETGYDKYLFIFDDYLAASFETSKGIDVSFYGFYSDLENASLITDGASRGEMEKSADEFIKNSFKAIGIINVYTYAVNVISLVPFIVLMLLVVTLLAYSILKLRGIESISGFGAMFKIVGTFSHFSGVIVALLTVIISFFVTRSIISSLPLVLFFATLAIRSMIFVINESIMYMKQLEQQEAERTEV